ncbi:hypothetical protein G7Y89_g11043 [Cudoniella acicularis]|uniref:Reverse transcriptase n=1 Tax=Cudoniella acicularis TaxID=354080 RepID=A0A8H4VYE9_9HELO|nr:hypothetical protein G7Y89_g11043 [Cudoniella acicularis]
MTNITSALPPNAQNDSAGEGPSSQEERELEARVRAQAERAEHLRLRQIKRDAVKAKISDLKRQLEEIKEWKNFCDDEFAAKKAGFIPQAKCSLEFIAFDDHTFKVENVYKLYLMVTDNRGETRPFTQTFYGYKNSGYTMAYAPLWDDSINILTPSEFEEVLEENPSVVPRVLYVTASDVCECYKNWSSCTCGGKSHSLYLPASDSVEDRLVFQVTKTSSTGPQIPEYLADFADVFDPALASDPPDLGDGVAHAIETTEDPPYGPLYNLSEPQLQALREYLADALEKRWIRPSVSPAGAPILFVPKKDGGLRLCVDYRGLNKVTVKNRHPLPLIDETLDRLVGAKIFTKLDLKDAYHRVRIKGGDEWKTAFRTRYGHFEYLVMPFGLANAPATFQAYVNTALTGLIDHIVVVYLDDILIYSKDPAKHEEHVRQVMARLRKNLLFAKLSKCEFSVEKVEFLGFIVGNDGVKADPERIRAIKDWPEPTTFREVQVFLGFANFYRRFVYRYSHIAAGLTTQLVGMVNGRKTGPYLFTDEARKSFKALKEAFTTTPVLIHFNPEKRIRVETDASKFAIAGSICQQEWNADRTKMHWHPVAFWSRKLSAAERNYTTYDGEMLAIVECFKQWRHYLEGSQHTIEVLTDHNNLRYFMNANYLAGRQARWAMYLATYDFEIKYRKGTANSADGPSRRPDYEVVESEDQTWLPTFQNKLKGYSGTFTAAVRAAISATTDVVCEGRRDMLRAFSVAFRDNFTSELETRLRLPRGHNLPLEKGPGPALPTSAEQARVLSLSMGDLPGGVDDTERPCILNDGGCKHLIPRTWINAVTRSSTALAPVTAPFTDLLRLAQSNDSFCQDTILAQRASKRKREGEPTWTFQEDLLRWNGRIYIPDDPALRAEVMRLHHDDPLAGHYGVEKTMDLLRRNYYWEFMEEYARKYISECDICQRVKAKRHKPYGLLNTLPQPVRPWSEISMDFITGLPLCKNPSGGKDFDCILVVVDRYSKMARYIPCYKTIDSPELATLLWKEVFSMFGTPSGIVSDRGTVFTSRFWSALCFYLFCKQQLSTAYHPQTDGQTERQNQALEHYLRIYCNANKTDWIHKLSFAEFTYNSSKHTVLNDTPFRVCYGYEPTLPWKPQSAEDRLRGEVPAARKRVEIIQREREKLSQLWMEAQANRERYYNQHRLDKHFKLHSWVMLSTKNIRLKAGKLGPKRIGPFKIKRCVGESAYELELPSLYARLHPVFNVSLLEDYRPRAGQDPKRYPTGELPELADEDELQEWEVEAIVDHDTATPAKRKYLIKWKDWPEDHNTWLPAYPNLNNAKEMLDAYNRNHGLVASGLPPKPHRTASEKKKGPGRPPKKRGPGRPRKT